MPVSHPPIEREIGGIVARQCEFLEGELSFHLRARQRIVRRHFSSLGDGHTGSGRLDAHAS